jgi:hypothetical protein
MICGDCFVEKVMCTDVFNDPELKLATLLRAAEAGNSFAQIEVADMYAISLMPIACILPSHHVAHCRAVTARGAWYPKLFAGTRLPAHKTAISAQQIEHDSAAIFYTMVFTHIVALVKCLEI